MDTKEHTQLPQNVIAHKEASAQRALDALAKGLQQGTVIRNDNGVKTPFRS
ncbi:hypothetical protein AB4Y45_33825 [Paraburkholderia sp. EG287A]|uniref:hypothetical protein n=1 Tax=Paraburkholderia sp. EG287A TaxID=3237012 RepID=UPI0034D33BC1